MSRSLSFRLDDSQSQGRDDEEAGPPPTSNSDRPSDADQRYQSSPSTPRWTRSAHGSELDLRSRLPTRSVTDETSSLLGRREAGSRSFFSLASSTPEISGIPPVRRNTIATTARLRRSRSKTGSLAFRLASLADSFLENSRQSASSRNRVWYDQFTSTDWVKDSIADAYRIKELRSRRDFKGRVQAWLDGAQGWILVAIIGCLTACIAFFINIAEFTIFDMKYGYCSTSWSASKRRCCSGASTCEQWKTWASTLSYGADEQLVGYIIYVSSVVVLALVSCVITLQSKTILPSTVSLSTLDENLGAENRGDLEARKRSLSPRRLYTESQQRPPLVYYSAAGSGVAEVKVILSGFVLHGYLGTKTLVVKSLALILSVASGLSLGKEGPYVHIATCIGNVACRLFAKYRDNDGKRREVLSASAAAGVAVAFGAPIGGVLFSLEEVSYFFPPKTMFRTFFCCIAAALFLKFLNPYGTSKIVLFEVRYLRDWHSFEMVVFVIVGMLGGILGALFIKASRLWAKSFRKIRIIKSWPILEVFLVALLTALTSYWNRYTKLSVSELLFELASPCDVFVENGDTLCPTKDKIPQVIGHLSVAFIIKALLTVITFGIKVPAGIYVPSMVVGGLMGRMVGHAVQYLVLNYGHTGLFGSCALADTPESCVVPGVYAMVAAGATMCGVTRLSVTLAVILFELTGSLDHVLPFSIGVLVSKWIADAIEPLSIYDLLTDMNSYPFLDSKSRPPFTTNLSEITPAVRKERIIDITSSSLVPASDLRSKLEYLHICGEIDGGLPLVRRGVLVGLLPAPDLEFALDKLQNEQCLCIMSTQSRWTGLEDSFDSQPELADFTPYIDPAPVVLDINSPMDLVYEYFTKLGLRHICVLSDGKYAGLVHRKAFVHYVKEVEKH